VQKFVTGSSAVSGDIPVSAKVYPGAKHFFDDPEYKAMRRFDDRYNSAVESQRGITAEYHEPSAKDAVAVVQKFLGRQVK
jgi:dienelactone hydrolase